MEYSKIFFTDLFSVKSIITILNTELEIGITPLKGEAHDFWEFVYVEKGPFKVNVDDKLYILNEGQALFYPPLSYHIGVEEKEHLNIKLNIVSFECDSTLMSFFSDRIFSLSAEQRKYLSQVISTGNKCLKSMPPHPNLRGMILREDTTPRDLLNIKNNFELLLIDMYEKNESTSSSPVNSNYENRDKATFDFLTAYLKNNIIKPLTLDEICSECLIGLSTLKRICHNYSGMSPIAYFISLKLDAAKTMISDTELNFTQISERLGFSTVHYFSKLFKMKNGTSPSQYAKSICKNNIKSKF